MMQFIVEGFGDLMQRGGVVMWPLLVLSIVSVTLAFERSWFFLRTNGPGRWTTVSHLHGLLREGNHQLARKLVATDGSIYGRVVRRLVAEPITESSAAEAIESQRRCLDRFMPTLSTIITVAPMLGILGTVLGIISSFEILSDRSPATDPRSIGQGIGEALITTAAGLMIAIITLFPYNAYRTQIDRTLSRLESLASAALSSAASKRTEGSSDRTG